jgi:hypothetical protein
VELDLFVNNLNEDVLMLIEFEIEALQERIFEMNANEVSGTQELEQEVYAWVCFGEFVRAFYRIAPL